MFAFEVSLELGDAQVPENLDSPGFFMRERLGPFLHCLDHVEALFLVCHLLLHGFLDWWVFLPLCAETERLGGLGVKEERLLTIAVLLLQGRTVFYVGAGEEWIINLFLDHLVPEENSLIVGHQVGV